MIGSVYFFDLRGDEKIVRVGFASSLSSRAGQHESVGQSFLAAMPASKDYEARIHSYFSAKPENVAPIDASRSCYVGDEVWSYVEWLVSRGFASTDLGSVAALPSLPWSVIDPAHMDLSWNDGNQRALFPMSRAERIAAAAAVAYHSSLSDEWYTPGEIIELARDVMGAIDLDPASCHKANQIVRATHYYDRKIDGLAPDRPWAGRVWMNPPYGGLAPKFADKLCAELRAGRTSEAVALFNANSLTSNWFDVVHAAARAILVTRGRLRFMPGDPDQPFSSPSTGSAIAYFGSRVDVFAEKFESVGSVLVPFRRGTK